MAEKWSKRDLLVMKNTGYVIVPCKDEQEFLQTRKVLKQNKRCAQGGYILNKNNEPVYFICTKRVQKEVS